MSGWLGRVLFIVLLGMGFSLAYRMLFAPGTRASLDRLAWQLALLLLGSNVLWLLWH